MSPPPTLLCSDLNLEFEVPFRELGFFGVPHRTNSFIMPTVNCLVELTEMPFTVLTLAGEWWLGERYGTDLCGQGCLAGWGSCRGAAQWAGREVRLPAGPYRCRSSALHAAPPTPTPTHPVPLEVNLVNLERVGFNLRNFDMVFIWKDLGRDVGRIDSIPSTSLDTIKVRGWGMGPSKAHQVPACLCRGTCGGRLHGHGYGALHALWLWARARGCLPGGSAELSGTCCLLG